MTTTEERAALTDGDRLIAVRAKYNLKQATIAKEVGIVQSTISMIEKGDRPMRMPIARVVEELTGGKVPWSIWNFDKQINKQQRKLDS